MNEAQTKPKNIHAAMSSIMEEVTFIAKGQRNAAQGFNYRGVDDIFNALHEMFAKAGVYIMPTVLNMETIERTTKSGSAMYYKNMTVKYQFTASDGSFVESTVIGEASDMADKGTNKAMSIALKYCLLQVFLIPTVEPKDPDADSPPENKPTAKEPATNAPAINAPTKTKVLPELKSDTENYIKCVAALKGGYKVIDLRKKYSISTEIEKSLLFDSSAS